MSDESGVAKVVTCMALDRSVLGKCKKVLVSTNLSIALGLLFEERALDIGVSVPDLTGRLFFRGVPVFECCDLNDMEYAFVPER